MKSALTLFALAAAALAGGVHAQTTAPDISVQFTGPTELELGRPDHYRLSVTNSGSAYAPTVSSTMIFPPGVELDTRLNTATGRYDPKVPANCSYAVTPSKRLTCLANNVAVGETRNYVIDLRAPLTGATIGAFTWTTVAAGDLNPGNNTVTFSTTFGNFAPSVGFNFPATLTYWTAIGRRSVLDNPMTRPSGLMTLDANGEGSGIMQGTPVTWKVTKVGNGINIKVNSSMYAPATEWNLTPFNSRCWQGMGYWTGMQDWYEQRACY